MLIVICETKPKVFYYDIFVYNARLLAGRMEPLLIALSKNPAARYIMTPPPPYLSLLLQMLEEKQKTKYLLSTFFSLIYDYIEI